MDLDTQYNLIYRFFKTTTEPYDDLEWDGSTLEVLLNDVVIERYSYDDLCDIIDGFR